MSLFRTAVYQCARLAVFTSLLAASALAAQAQVVFSPPKNISNSSGNAQAQQIAVDANGNVNLVWADNSLGNYAIFLSHSSDSGATFSTPRSISKHAQSRASGPQIAVDANGNVSVVWTETSPDGSANFIYFSHSTDGGVTFTNPHNISGDAGAVTSPRMAVDSSGAINIVWTDTSLGNSEIFFSRSADGGTIFSTPMNISNDAGDSVFPSIAGDASGNINVVWADDTPGIKYDVFFSRSTDAGASFSTPHQLTNSDTYDTASAAQVASGADGNIDLIWIQRNPSSSGAVFSRSTDGGATFSTTGGIRFGFSFATSIMMALDPTGNNVGVVEQYTNFDEPGSPFVSFIYSADAGASFSGGGGLGAQTAHGPQIAVDAIGRIDATYAQGQYYYYETPCLCFFQSADGLQHSGVIITSYVPTTPAAMAVDPSGNVSVAWLQSATSGGNANVFFSRGAVPPFSFSLSLARVLEGVSSTGIVKLISPAPARGATISLSSSNPSVVSVPATVTVPEGASSATFTVATNAVGSFTTSVTVTASFDGSVNTATLSVDPLFQFFVNGNTTGGNTAGGEVALPQSAPSGGLTIALSSSDPSVASVPASVTVPAGSRFAFFNIHTSSVTAATTVQISGTSNGFTHSISFTVQPARVQQFSVSPTTATGGASSTGTVTLTGPAPAGGATVSLSSSDPSATVPASVTIPAGSTSASFSITTNPGPSTTNVTISASYNGVTLNATLTVRPLIVTGITVSPSTIGGGGTADVRVCMNVVVPFDTVVSISSSNPSVASVPASVTIPQDSGCWFFNVVKTSPVSADTNVTISAAYGGVTVTGTFTVQPIRLLYVNVGSATGGNTTNGQVVLNGPAPAGGITVSLSSSNPSVASVPASVFIPAGVNPGQFAVSTTPVSATTPVTVSASYNGVTVTFQFPVFPPQ